MSEKEKKINNSRHFGIMRHDKKDKELDGSTKEITGKARVSMDMLVTRKIKYWRVLKKKSQSLHQN